MKKLTNKNIVQLYYEELWNKKNKDFLNLLLDENITFYSSLGLEIKGKQEFNNYMNTIHSSIPDLFHSIIDIVCEEDCIAVRAICTGKQVSKLFDYHTTNDRIIYNIATFFKFKNKKICNICLVTSLNTLIK